ncbi:hypothetical protein BCR32DRAFT_273466 [Anaeromyces robustus]|uniref:Periplasmic binding protein-like II n=1 Tax=Anaeromyces robustus TaxID=1754192 RepID=A0A1Y1VPS8_9FUNG|nr:hypothetical protein BCR32DRAFT_273466 [Anaeromyces robustus]|eukprot:ORX63321.1 hypothetical protein BCR32DRAFT_273466 [Anaeromyces robustus]
MIENFLQKKSVKYDIYFFFDSFTEKYGQDLVDLEEYLPKEHIDLFDQSLLNISCIYNHKIVGMPVTVDMNVLYSNKNLLEKYDKKPPKTWDELIETGKYIKEKEEELNNYVVGFNGMFSGTTLIIFLFYFTYIYYIKKIDIY